jgi:hypothetical protein
LPGRHRGALVVDKSVLIAEPGRDQLTVDGQDATQVFSISSFETMPTVTISSVAQEEPYYGGGRCRPSRPPTVTITNSTLSGNRADETLAGAICNGGDVVEIKNAILAAGPTGANLWNIGDFGGTIASSGYNLSSDDGGGFLTATGDRINTDPKLGALADNGGPTWTCALLAGSPAIDTGNSTDIDGNSVATDQRGVARPQGSGYDIGAFELHPAASPMDMKTGVLGEMRTLRATLTGKDDQAWDSAVKAQSLKP